jgi:RNA polymerase sigma factor (sigma-70 family)
MFSKDFISQCMQQDRKALNALYDLLKVQLMATATRYTQDNEEAKSNVNQAFVRIVTNLSKYNHDLSFMAWANRIIINVSIDEYNKKNKLRKINLVHTDFTETQHFTEPVETPFYHEEHSGKELIELIKKLPPTTAKVFNLYAIDGYSHDEIGEMLGMKNASSRWHLSNARQMLQEFLVKKKASNMTSMTTMIE